MESEAEKIESNILDETPETVRAKPPPEVGKPGHSSTEGNKVSQPTGENRTSETTSEKESLGTTDNKENLADKGLNGIMDQSKQLDGEVGNAGKASKVKTGGSAGDETKENVNKATKEPLNGSVHSGATVAENNKDKEAVVTETQEEANLSPSQATKRKLDHDSETKDDAGEESSKPGNASDKSNAASKPIATLPKRPIKRARTAYFIFTDEKRPEVQAAHPGEGVAAVAKALGQMWGSLSAEEKKVYQDQAAKERERVSQELEAYKAAGGKDLDLPSIKAKDPLATILPVARIRKICKLDPEIRALSKEALLLVTKCTELMLQKLGKETVKVAQLQNRRKLLPDDIAHVCAHREQFLFLKDDVKDLVRTMESSSDGKAGGGKKGDAAKQAAAVGTKKLTSYFSAPK